TITRHADYVTKTPATIPINRRITATCRIGLTQKPTTTVRTSSSDAGTIYKKFSTRPPPAPERHWIAPARTSTTNVQFRLHSFPYPYPLAARRRRQPEIRQIPRQRRLPVPADAQPAALRATPHRFPVLPRVQSYSRVGGHSL